VYVQGIVTLAGQSGIRELWAQMPLEDHAYGHGGMADNAYGASLLPGRVRSRNICGVDCPGCAVPGTCHDCRYRPVINIAEAVRSPGHHSKYR
jgi:hypothetical protein